MEERGIWGGGGGDIIMVLPKSVMWDNKIIMPIVITHAAVG